MGQTSNKWRRRRVLTQRSPQCWLPSTHAARTLATRSPSIHPFPTAVSPSGAEVRYLEVPASHKHIQHGAVQQTPTSHPYPPGCSRSRCLRSTRRLGACRGRRTTPRSPAEQLAIPTARSWGKAVTRLWKSTACSRPSLADGLSARTGCLLVGLRWLCVAGWLAPLVGPRCDSSFADRRGGWEVCRYGK